MANGKYIHQSSHITSQKQESSSLESLKHSDVIVYQPSHHLTVILTRKINTGLHSTVVVACCFDYSPLPLCFTSHNYLTCPSIFRPAACKHRRALVLIFPSRMLASSTCFWRTSQSKLSTWSGAISVQAADGKLAFWVTVVPVVFFLNIFFSCVCVSRFPVWVQRVKKPQKQTEEAAHFSTDRQPTDRKEGRTITLVDKFFTLLSSIPLQKHWHLSFSRFYGNLHFMLARRGN